MPLVTPYVQKAQAKVEPYTKPTIDAVSPYVKRAWNTSRPYYIQGQKRAKLIYKRHIDPARKRAIKKLRAQADPYVKKAQTQYSLHVQPHVDTIERTVTPYYRIYQRDVSPYVQKAYQYSRQSSSVTYAFYMDKLHPRVVQALRHLHSFLINHVQPALRRFYSLYVRPQGERLLAKVYERKAHYLGSDAIKAAQKESKNVGKQADAQAKVSVKNAEEEAIMKAKQDPSQADIDAHQATEDGQETDPVKIAQLDAELEAEEEKVREQLEVWEEGMSSLIQKEFKLAIERLIELRNRYVTDLPDRFGTISEAFAEDQVASILSRIERGLKKLSAPTQEAPLTERLSKARTLIDQQLANFDAAAEAYKVELAQFHEDLLSKERHTVETSTEEIRRYALAAKQDYDKIMKDAKFSVTFDEYTGWDKGVQKRTSLFRTELEEVQAGKKPVEPSSGAPDLHDEAADVAREVASLRTFSDRLHLAARREVERFAESGLAQMRGEGVIAQISDVVDSVVEQASSIGVEATAGMLGIVSVARSKLGLQESTDKTGYFARAKAFVQQAADSVSEGAASLADDAASVAHEATRSLSSAVGATPTPETPAEYVESIANNGYSAAASAAAAASSAVLEAQSFVIQGSAQESVASVYDAAASNVASAYSSVASAGSSVVDRAAEAVSQATEQVVTAAGIKTAPTGVVEHASSLADVARSTLAEVGESASSVAHEATKAAIKAAGGTPEPDTFGERVEQVLAAGQEKAAEAASSVSSVLESVSSEHVAPASEAVSEAVHQATRSVLSAVGATPSPEGFQEHVEYATDKVKEAASRVRDEL